MRPIFLLCVLFCSCSSPIESCIDEQFEKIVSDEYSNVKIISSEMIHSFSGEQIQNFWINKINRQNLSLDSLILSVEEDIHNLEGLEQKQKEWRFRLQQIKTAGPGYEVKKIHFSGHDLEMKKDTENDLFVAESECNIILSFTKDEYDYLDFQLNAPDSLSVIEYIKFEDAVR